MEQEGLSTWSESCRNCGAPLPPDAKFCPNCGQKNSTGKITVWQVLKDAFDTIFNIDSRLIRTLGAIFIPGKLTIEYFRGKHKRYAMPFRLFFLIALVHFTTLGVVTFKAIQFVVEDLQDAQKRAVYKSELQNEIQDAKRGLMESTFSGDSTVSKAIDSLAAKLDYGTWDMVYDIGYFYYDPQEGWKVEAFEILPEDISSLSEQELLEKQKVPNNFLAQIQFRQSIRLLKNPGDFFRFAMGQLIWMVIMMMFALGLILKLLYIRRDKYYVEHLVFSFHYHAFAFLIVTIPLLFMWFNSTVYRFEDISLSIGGAIACNILYLLIAMKRVYRQGWFKTFIKFCLLNLAYIFIFNLFLFLSLLVSLLIF